ncbi:MAG: NADP oxidoreductase, partial [Euzebya sp.]
MHIGILGTGNVGQGLGSALAAAGHTGGMVSLAALAACDPADLVGKVLVDVANPLDFSGGFPPRLAI